MQILWPAAIFIHIVLLTLNVDLFDFKRLFNLANTSQIKFLKWSYIIIQIPSAKRIDSDFKLTTGE
jgi:hypothetical protein